MSRNGVIISIIVLVVLAGGLYKLRHRIFPSPAQEQVVQSAPVANSSTGESSPAAAMSENLVKITSDGFSPKVITIKAGEKVTWTNSDSAPHTVNSNPHPTHTAYPPLNLGVVQAGGGVSLMFDKAGTYTYHDHLNPSLTGSVVVQ